MSDIGNLFDALFPLPSVNDTVELFQNLSVIAEHPDEATEKLKAEMEKLNEHS